MDHTTFDIILEVIKYLGVLTTAFFLWLSATRGKKLKVHKEENKNLKEVIYDLNEIKLKEIFDLRRFSEMELKIKRIFKSTRCDRFGIVFALNGQASFDFITVLYDQKIGDTKIGSKSSYQHFAIDDTYKKLIKKLEFEGHVWGNVGDKSLGNIAEFMRIEDIYAAGWFFIERVKISKHSDIVLFAVFSTSDKEGYTNQDKNVVQLMANGKLIPKIREIISTDLEKEDVLDE